MARGNCVGRAVLSIDVLSAKLRSTRTRYREESKVLKEVEKRLDKCGAKEWITYAVNAVEEESFLQETKGRPGPDTRYRRQVKERFRLVFDLDHEKLDDALRQDGVFPLVTNDRTLSAAQLLTA